jgi:hypothetical protein
MTEKDEINKDFKTNDLSHYKQIWGGIALPGKKKGFDVVVGSKNHDIYVLDEFESWDTHELITQCILFEYKYQPQMMWFGDGENKALKMVIHEVNAERQSKNKNPELIVPVFSIITTKILEMDKPYTYILPELKSLLREDRRQLFLGDSTIVEYLSVIKEADMPELNFGDYPAIEALAFAVIEMRQWSRPSVTTTRAEDDKCSEYDVLNF